MAVKPQDGSIAQRPGDSDDARPQLQSDLQEWELLFLLGMGFQLQLRDFVAALDEAGYSELRPIHGLIFQAIRSGNDTGSQIAAAVGVTKQAATLLIDELETWGYVHRQPHPQGGRRKQIAMTDKGRAHFVTAGRVLRDQEARLSERLTPSAVTQLRTHLIEVITTTAGEALPPFRPTW